MGISYPVAVTYAAVVDSGALPSASVLDYIPLSLHAAIRAKSYTADILTYLQSAADAAAAAGKNLVIPRGRYYTFGEWLIDGVSVYFEPGAELYVTRDDLAGMIVQGDNAVVCNPYIIGLYATPAIGPNAAGCRVRRASTDPNYSGLPYNQGGIARQPWRDRNAGVLLINSDKSAVIGGYIENFNIGVAGYGSYTATNANPGVYTASDWRTDGTFDAGNGNAPISWPTGLWNSTSSQPGYMYDCTVENLHTKNCDQGIFLFNQVRGRIFGHVNQDTSYIQTSPPHAIYWTSSDGYNFPNIDCIVDNVQDTNNTWSSSFKFEQHRRLTFNGKSNLSFAGVYSNDCDDSSFIVNTQNISTPFAEITGSWAAGTTTITVSDSSELEVGLYLTADLSSYGLPTGAQVATIVDAVTVTITEATTAASPGTVTVYAGTNSASSCIVGDKGSQRTRFQIVEGTIVDNEDDSFGFIARVSASRVLRNFALTTGTAAAGQPDITFDSATFPAEPAATWIARMLPYFMTEGTTVSAVATVGPTTTVTLSANLLQAVPAGTWVGFYFSTTLVTTAPAALGASALTFASTAGVYTNFYVEGPAGLQTLTKISSVSAGNTTNLNRPLIAAVPSGTTITFRSDLWSDLYMPDRCEIYDSTIFVQRSSSSIPLFLYRSEGSHVTFSRCNAVSYPIASPTTKYAWYIGGHPKGTYNSQIIDPGLEGVKRIVDVDSQCAGFEVSARNVLLRGGTDASTVHDASGITGASVFILDSVRTGTWTPSFVGTTIAGANTYSTQTGYYRRWNDMVFVQLRMNLTSFLSTGYLQIHGLPWTPVSTVTVSAQPTAYATGFTVASGELLLGRMLAAQTKIELFRRNVTNTDPAFNCGAVSGSALVTASIATGVLTVTAVSNGTLAVGQVITSGASTVGTISSLGTGTGGTGTYNLTGGVDTGSGTLSASGGTTTGRLDISFTYITQDAFR